MLAVFALLAPSPQEATRSPASLVLSGTPAQQAQPLRRTATPPMPALPAHKHLLGPLSHPSRSVSARQALAAVMARARAAYARQTPFLRVAPGMSVSRARMALSVTWGRQV